MGDALGYDTMGGQSLPSHVMVPLVEFRRMAQCYYGGGPRLDDLQSPPPTAPLPEREGEPARTPDVGILSELSVERKSVREWTPKGFAAKKAAARTANAKKPPPSESADAD